MVMLASFVAVPRLTSNATRRVVGQWGGAGGASREDHFRWREANEGRVVDKALLGELLLVSYRTLANTVG